MRAMRYKRPCCLIFCLILGYCFLLIREQLSTRTKPLSPIMETNRVNYLVDTPGCKIPDLDPFDDTIREYIREQSPLHCEIPGKKPLTFQDGRWLRLDLAALEQWRMKLWFCELAAIIRHPSKDSLIRISAEKIRFQSDIEVKDEFIKIQCFDTDGRLAYSNFHAFILPKPWTEQQELGNRFRRYKAEYKIKKHLNVLLLGVDSISRLNSLRQFAKTRNFLLTNLNAVEMKGYNKVGDNTFENLTPLLSGKFVRELPYNRSMTGKTFDDYDFIWKHFASMGFQTFFAEDMAWWAMFNCANKSGFARPPVDYYLRPFSVAIQRQGVWSNDHNCFNGRSEIDSVLDWLYDFTRFKGDEPYFALTFLTKISHGDVNKIGSVDEVYMNFLQKLQSSGCLDNTALFFFADHGLRYGPFRNTYYGKLEDRLPMMYVSLPEWFKAEHSFISQNLLSNANRLTTHFDIHETLKDILFMNTISKFPVSDVSRRGISLFDEISPERTCRNASIHPHWCSCYSEESVAVDSEIIQRVANVAVEFLNELTFLSRVKCARLILATIHKAFLVSRSEIDRKAERLEFVDHQITFTTYPGEGRFESTVRHFVTEDRFSITGDISRTNRYGDQSDCIQDFSLKKYCFCT